MIRNMIEDLKDSAAAAVRLTSLVIAAAISLFIAISFLCAAAFVMVLQRHGLVAACFAGAGVFFAVTLITAGGYAYAKRKARKPAAPATKSAFASAMSDPMVLTAGLQVLRTVGVKRLLPLLAIGGVMIGLMVQRGAASQEGEPAE